MDKTNSNAPRSPSSTGNQHKSLPSNPLTNRKVQSSGVSTSQKSRLARKRKQLILIALTIVLLITITTVTGSLAGYISGEQSRQKQEYAQIASNVQEQYNLALVDLAEGSYELARQRFDYVLSQDPDFPGAADSLTRVLLLMHTTATPTLESPTITPTTTTDPRPAQELFSRAEELLSLQDWKNVIETLISLRKENAGFNTARVDGMLYLALRHRGLQKILNENNLEGGIYDLALAENFGPLDIEAERVRNLARLYIIGSSFWEAYPEQAVYYFSQVASAAPYLRDASGWTATDRYQAALIQYGDQFAKNEDWCSAQEQYEAAYTIGADGNLLAKIEESELRCSPQTETPTIMTPTPTITGTITTTATYFGTPTGTLFPTAATPTNTAALPIPTSTPTPNTPVPPSPTQTPEPTEPPATATPTPTAPPPDQPTSTP